MIINKNKFVFSAFTSRWIFTRINVTFNIINDIKWYKNSRRTPLRNLQN